jgi:hypothetical protein
MKNCSQKAPREEKIISRLGRNWEGNINMVLKDKNLDNAGCIYLLQGSDQCWLLFNMVINS